MSVQFRKPRMSQLEQWLAERPFAAFVILTVFALLVLAGSIFLSDVLG